MLSPFMLSFVDIVVSDLFSSVRDATKFAIAAAVFAADADARVDL